jgi:aerobic carbon-monoxide dehydrogenase medium subunit
MIPASFDYIKASSVSEAIGFLKGNPDAKILAGGHSLIPAMKLRLSQPAMLVDISTISELNFIRDRGKYIAIGAGTTHGTIASHKTIVNKIPMLAAAASLIGDPAVRNKGTIGGSIAHADPASDWPAVLIATDATIKVEGPFGDRTIPAADFFKGFFYTELGENELVTEIHVPDPTSSDAPDSYRMAYEKFMQPASRFAIVGCAVKLKMGADGKIAEANVAFNGVSDHAYSATDVENALIGRELSTETAADVCHAATLGVELIMSDHYADEAYRKHLAKVICQRAIESCMHD